MRRNQSKDGSPVRKILAIVFTLGVLMAAARLLYLGLGRQRADSSLEALRSVAHRQLALAESASPLAAEASAGSEGSAFQPEASAPEESLPVGNELSVAENSSTTDLSFLRQASEEAVAWLSGPGADLDYPVMHGSDNEYYLSHLFNGERSEYGSLFVDCRNAGDFSDRNTVIYGHHMDDGSMFGRLEAYKNQAWYDQYPTMTLYTPYGNYRVELICGTVETGEEEFVQLGFPSEESFQTYLAELRTRSTFASPVQVGPGETILSLCTCSYDRENGRYQLIGKLVPLV